jgi:hypothetical protein
MFFFFVLEIFLQFGYVKSFSIHCSVSTEINEQDSGQSNFTLLLMKGLKEILKD